MASDINKDKGGSHRDPLSWDNMKDGIFTRVLMEEPDYFTPPEKKRRGAWIFFTGAISVMVILLLVYVTQNQRGATPSIETRSDKIETHEASNRQHDNIPVIDSLHDRETRTSRHEASKEILSMQLENSPGKVIPAVTTHDMVAPSDPITSNNVHEYAPRAGNINSKKNKADGDDEDSAAPVNSRSSFDIQPLRYESKLLMTEDLVTTDNLRSRIDSFSLAIRPASSPSTSSGNRAWQLSGTAGSLFSASGLAGDSRAVILRNAHTSGIWGFSGGVGATYNFAKSSNLSFGLSYEQAYQNIDISTEREIEVTQTEVLLRVTHFVVGNRRSETYGDTTVNAIEKNRLVYTNTFRWLYFNLGAGHTFGTSKWQVGPAIGASFGRQWSEGYTVAADGQILQYNRANPIHAQNSIKVWAELAVIRQLTDDLDLNIAYRIDKQLNNASVESDVVFKPFFQYLNLGISLRIGGKG